MRRIGILLPAAADDAEFQARVGAFLQALALLGWTIGRNVRIDTRWATANAGRVIGDRKPRIIPKPMEWTGLLELSHLKKGGEAVIHQSKLKGVEAMVDTELQIEKHRVSDQRMRVLKQQAVVLSLNREGGERLQEAAEHLN